MPFALFFRNSPSATLTGKVNQLEVILKQLQHELKKVGKFTVLVQVRTGQEPIAYSCCAYQLHTLVLLYLSVPGLLVQFRFILCSFWIDAHICLLTSYTKPFPELRDQCIHPKWWVELPLKMLCMAFLKMMARCLYPRFYPQNWQ